MTSKLAVPFLRILTGLGIILAILGGVSVYIIAFGGMSRIPDATNGHIFPFNNHGTIAYVSKVQFLASEYGLPVMMVGVILATIGRKLRGKNVLGKWVD